MSCPDWERLLTWRHDPRADEPEGWRRALEHLAHCRSCRRRAFVADPTLLFQTLPRPEVEAGETEEIKQAVRALRRAGRFDGLGRMRRPRRLEIAAAALLAALLLVPMHAGLGRREPAGDAGRRPFPATVALSRSLPHERLPLIEILDRPLVRIYQLGDDEVSLVMIVDESLDV